MRKTPMIALTLLVVLTVCLAFSSSDSDADGEERKVLMDMGNGQTYWSMPSGSTVDAVMTAAFSENDMTFKSSGTTITVDGLTTRTIGETVSSWNFYTYTDGSWVRSDYDGSAAYSDAYIAVGFYPSDMGPTVTPAYKNAWTCIHGDSLNSGSYTNYEPSEYTAQLQYVYGTEESPVPCCYASPLYANGNAVMLSTDYYLEGSGICYDHMISINLETGDTNWEHTYKRTGYDMATPAIMGNCAYFASDSGMVYKIPMTGDDAGKITAQIHLSVNEPSEDYLVDGSVVMVGLSSIVYDSGHLFIGSSGGQVYCLDMDLNLIWTHQLNGAVYPSTSISVANGMVYIGACDGRLYILNETDGSLRTSLLIYFDEESGGRIGTPAVMGDYIIVSYNDGQGMLVKFWGTAVLRYNSQDNLINFVQNLPDLTVQSNYLVIAPGGGFVYGLGMNSKSKPVLYRIYTNGGYEELFKVTEIHGGMTLVNNTYFYGVDYTQTISKVTGSLRVYNMSGECLTTFDKPTAVNNYSMAAVFVCGEYIGAATDSGAYFLKGTMVNGTDPPGPTSAEVDFLISDNTGFYVTITGKGTTVMDAFENAVKEHNYYDYVEYSGSIAKPENLESMFGLEYKKVSDTEYMDWMTFKWDSEWVHVTDNMSDMVAEDYSSILLYYGTTDGSSFVPREGLPAADALQPLTISSDGVRFLVESDTGAFFVINGTGDTLSDALLDALVDNGIPYILDGDTITLFAKAATSEIAWNRYSATTSGWSADTSSMSGQSASDIKLYAIYFGSSSSVPTISMGEISDDPISMKVKFLICDGTEFYLVIEGEGLTVINALVNAIDTYNYTKYAVYSGTESQPEGLRSLFGLTYKQLSDTEYVYWMTFTWSYSEDYWVTSSNTMEQMYADEQSAILLYYGKTDGMEFDPPDGLPKIGELQPLKISEDGVRFLVESETGAFFVMNGEGSTLGEALDDACTTNNVPYSIDGNTVTFFNKTATSDNGWNHYSASSSGWSLDTSTLSDKSASDVKVYAFYYGSASALPTIAVEDVYDGNLSNVKEDYVPIILAIVVAVLIIAFLVYLYHRARTHNMSMVWAFKDMIKPSNTSSKTKQNKIRLLIVCIIGLILTVVMFLCSLAIGPSVTLSLPETFNALISSIGKSGKDLTFQEIVVYQTRLPRTLAVLAVGIGLSIAGCVYQAIIRNPLVDPYIMGVSSGAGTFAVAALAADFTFFGLLANTTYATPILAIVGGLLAFGMTLLIAERAGGSSTNYVLAGVVIGLVFSAIQTVLLVTAKSNKLMSAISWLFGSFANVGWDTVWIIVFPALLLSIVPLVWAKELNLVLLGEDQARQMGLNVRKFNRWMLIVASVLTSVCVAFVGIIGFVGMVIPHLCRMILGGDHRLVLPSSIIMGGALLLFADLMAKMLMIPTELPVGAITTIIGVPVFAYLLIKKGRMYSG